MNIGRTFVNGVFIILFCSMTFGCATLNSRQKSELEQYKAQDGVYVEEKSPGTATALGILPGGGSFYTRQWGLGVVDLLLWPFSILWDPIAGYEGALVINHDETVLRAKQKMKKELEVVEEKLDKKEISEEEYRRERHKIEQKYSVD